MNKTLAAAMMAVFSWGTVQAEQLTIKCVDAETQKSIEWPRGYSSQEGKWKIGNESGEIVVEVMAVNDTIKIAAFGYIPVSTTTSTFTGQDTALVALKSVLHPLGEVTALNPKKSKTITKGKKGREVSWNRDGLWIRASRG